MTLLSRHMPFAGSEIPVYPDNPRCELSCPGHVFFFSVKLMIIDPDPETNWLHGFLLGKRQGVVGIEVQFLLGYDRFSVSCPKSSQPTPTNPNQPQPTPTNHSSIPEWVKGKIYRKHHVNLSLCRIYLATFTYRMDEKNAWKPSVWESTSWCPARFRGKLTHQSSKQLFSNINHDVL